MFVCLGFLHLIIVSCLNVSQYLSIHPLKDTLVPSNFDNYEESCWKHPCVGFSVNLSIGVNTKECDCWIVC